MSHEPHNSRFVVHLAGFGDGDDGSDMASLSYALTPGSSSPCMDLQHTYTPEAMRGRGVAGRLVAAAFAHARENGMKVIPTCSYIPVWVRRHPEEMDIVRAPE